MGLFTFDVSVTPFHPSPQTPTKTLRLALFSCFIDSFYFNESKKNGSLYFRAKIFIFTVGHLMVFFFSQWVQKMVQTCQPEKVWWVDGSEDEYRVLCDQLVECGTFTRLNPKKRPNSFLCRSDPLDVARVESRTFICTKHKEVRFFKKFVSE